MVVSQPVAGTAPMKQKSPVQSRSCVAPVARLVRRMRVSDVSPCERRHLGVGMNRDARVSQQSLGQIRRHAGCTGREPRTMRFTALSREAKYNAACPAELAPPITATG